MFENFIQRYKNAVKVVHQIKNGEWIPQLNSIDLKHDIAIDKNNEELWLAYGGCYLTILLMKPCPFGLFWRHYVWWFAARKLKKDADKTTQKVPVL